MMALKVLVFAGFIIVVQSSCPQICPAGTFLISPSTCECSSCPNDTYMDQNNNATSCKPCTFACSKSKIISKKCTNTSDAVCQCPPGQYYDTGILFCMECTICNKGYGTEPCSTEQNTNCEPCVPGKTYTNSSGTRPCRACSVCQKGYKIKTPCNTTRDTTCQKETFISTTSTHKLFTKETNNNHPVTTKAESHPTKREPYVIPVLAVVIVAVICLLFGLVVWCYRKHRNRGHQHAIDQDVEDREEVLDLKEEKTSTHTPSRHSGLRGRHIRHPRRLEQSRRKYPEPISSTEEHKLLNSDILMRDVPYLVVEQLALKLNPRGLNNWVRLAGQLNYPKEQVDYFGMDPENATQRMFNDWKTLNTSTAGVLYERLKAMGRDDAAEVLENLV